MWQAEGRTVAQWTRQWAKEWIRWTQESSRQSGGRVAGRVDEEQVMWGWVDRWGTVAGGWVDGGG